ncbi:MAG: PqqD family peptide modification chaperone, partial [Actinomycetota bacterium]|nr:PqqD family peptide modification chaperone [Actinomycetota bacterium]
CLAKFAHDSGATTGRRPVADGSLLPVASERCEIIGQWLLERGGYLRTDAHTLLERLLGRWPRTAAAAEDGPTGTAFDYAASAPLEFRRCASPDRVLVGRLSSVPRLYWVNEDAALLLELLGHTPVDDIVDTFAHRWSMTPPDATHRLSALLSDLSASGLVTTDRAAAMS